MRPPHIGLPMMIVLARGREQRALSPTYARAVQVAGGVPIPIPLLGEAEGLWTLYRRLDGLHRALFGALVRHAAALLEE